MAVEGQIPLTYSLVAGEDLSLHQYKLMQRTAAGRATRMQAMTNFFAGILDNKPKNLEHATLSLVGITKGIVGGAVTAGQYLATGATSGFLFVAVSGSTALGRAWETVGSGGIATVQLFGGAYHTMTTSNN